jgi:hypothetical protein
MYYKIKPKNPDGQFIALIDRESSSDDDTEGLEENLHHNLHNMVLDEANNESDLDQLGEDELTRKEENLNEEDVQRIQNPEELNGHSEDDHQIINVNVPKEEEIYIEEDESFKSSEYHLGFNEGIDQIIRESEMSKVIMEMTVKILRLV